MKRFTSLVAWSIFLVAAIAIVSPADAKPRRAKRACPNCAPQYFAPQACYGGSICLQYLLYEDDEIAMWLVDHFADTVCEGNPLQEFLITAPGEAAPQSCGPNAFPQCSGDGTFLVGSGLRGTAMGEPLGPNNADNYVKKLTDDDQTVKYPSNSGGPQNLDTVWHPHSGATELQFQFVKARKKGGGWVVIRLSTGFVMMENIDFAGNAKPIQHKRPHRNFDFGLESTKPPAGIPDNRIVTPIKWDRYPESETAFLVKFRGVTYHVLAQNPVEF